MRDRNTFDGARRMGARLLILGLGLWLAYPQSALACSCVDMPFEEHLARLESLGNDALVFEGVARELGQPRFASSSMTPVRYRFDVRRSWLNEVGTSLDVATAMSSA
mgnify:CR=1 FL=1